MKSMRSGVRCSRPPRMAVAACRRGGAGGGRAGGPDVRAQARRRAGLRGRGLKLSFDAINKAGGVNGHTLSPVRKDDLGQPEQTVALTKPSVAENRPMVLAGYFGTRNIAALVASGALEERLALVGYRSSELRAPPPLLFNMHADLREELTRSRAISPPSASTGSASSTRTPPPANCSS